MKMPPLLILAVIFLQTGCATLRLAARSEEGIQRGLLKETPLGSSESTVLQFVRSEYKDEPSVDSENSEIVVGLGMYPTFPPFFSTFVYATWRFDENNKLSSIDVVKSGVGP